MYAISNLNLLSSTDTRVSGVSVSHTRRNGVHVAAIVVTSVGGKALVPRLGVHRAHLGLHVAVLEEEVSVEEGALKRS